jgi:hypothetical protein
MRPHYQADRKDEMHEDHSHSPKSAVDRPFFSGLEPGQRVRHPGRPDWGSGQVQSVVGSRITVNFENAGKVLINARLVGLEPMEA